MTTPGNSDEQLRALCVEVDAIFDAMADAFATRAASLARDHAHANRLPDSAEWNAAWMRHLLATLRVPLSDPAIIRALADAAAFGKLAGFRDRDHVLGMHALAWACRDVFPTRTTPGVMAAIESRATLLSRVIPRAAIDTTESDITS